MKGEFDISVHLPV